MKGLQAMWYMQIPGNTRALLIQVYPKRTISVEYRPDVTMNGKDAD
jgi:hypothetical protein